MEQIKDRLDKYRQDNPKYAKLSDEKLLEEIYARHYSKVDRKEFMERFNPPPPPPSAEELIGREILDSLSKIKSAIDAVPDVEGAIKVNASAYKKQLDALMVQIRDINTNLRALKGQMDAEKPEETPMAWTFRVKRDEDGYIKTVEAIAHD